MSVLGSPAPGAHIAEAFVLEAHQERRTVIEARGWMAAIQR